MSRVGKKPIPIPSGVTVQIFPDAVEVKGPKGTLRQPLPPWVVFEMNDGKLEAQLKRDDRALSKFHGLARSLVANAVTGVTEGYTKTLELMGVGYRVIAASDGVILSVGYSHPVEIHPPEGVTMEVEGNNRVHRCCPPG